MTERHAPDSTIKPGLPDLALLTTVFLWSSNFIITKDQFDLITPLAFMGVRFALMVMLAFGVLAVRSGKLETTTPRRADFGRMVIAGLTGYTLYQIGFVEGLDKTSVFSSSLLISTVPLWTMLMLRFTGERSSAVAWIGLALAVSGVVLFLLEKRDGSSSYAGDLLSLGAAISFAIYGIVNRPLVKSYPAATYTAYTMLIGAIPLVLISLPAVIDQNWTSLPASSGMAMGYNVIFPVYVAYILWNFGIAHRGAAIASSFGLLAPVLSGTLSSIFFDEQFSVLKLLGGAMVLCGLLLIRMGPLLVQRWQH